MKLYKSFFKLVFALLVSFNLCVGNVNAASVNPYDFVIARQVEGTQFGGGGSQNVTGGTTMTEDVMTCEDVEVIEAVRIFSYAITIIKTMIPLILIISTVKQLVNAIIAQDDGEIKKLSGTFITKFCIAVFIFFVPTIVNVFIGMVDNYDTTKAQYTKCADCLTNLNACDSYMGAADISETQFGKMCDSLFGDPNNSHDTAHYLQVALDVIKYSGIIACISLTIVEFAKAVIGDNKEMLKPLSQKLFTRMIYVVVLFFLPIITEVILRMIGVYGTCSLK